MITGSEKINELLKYLNITPSEFAKKIGLSYPQNVYDIQKGRIDISKAMAGKITSVFPEISREWLLTGIGSMLKSTMDKEDTKSRSTLESNDLSLLINYLREKDVTISELHYEIKQLAEEKSRYATLLEIEKEKRK